MMAQQKNAIFAIQDTTDLLRIRTPRYELAIGKDGFTIRLYRGSELILESAGPQDAAGNLSFEANGKEQRVTKLKSFKRIGQSLSLEYATTYGEASALAEVQPFDTSVRITSWLLHSDGNLTPSFRYRLAPSGLWYGGGFQGWRDPQVFPLNEAHLSKEAFLAQGNTQGTPAWYTTKGVAVWVRTPHDFRYSFNRKRDGKDDGLFSVEMPGVSALQHDILIEPNIRQAAHRIIREIGYAKSMPPADYFRLPIYTTWVEFKVDVDQAKVLDYARNIKKNNLPCGVIEIDDKWESRYGDMEFDKTKFPDAKAMVDELHRLGYRVTLWVHPFVNTDADTFETAGRENLLIRDLRGKPGLMKWWNGIAAVWDLTIPKAAAEFRGRLKRLQTEYGLDGFKFDGGDANLLPQDLRTDVPITTAQYCDIYNREATAHFEWEETRVGVYSQPLGIVQRLIDKQSIWGKNNGLGAILPEAITVSTRGFAFVMPDMIGGNQYDNDKIDKELLIRWAQASALMPLMQFSWAPWHFDEEAVRLSREASELHVKFARLIVRLAQDNLKTGDPILRPLWYNSPDDAQTHRITDQFMLGNDVVVAPVLEKGAQSRDIYLPAGQWIDLATGKTHAGGAWLKNFPAPLAVLPMFVRQGSEAARTGAR